MPKRIKPHRKRFPYYYPKKKGCLGVFLVMALGLLGALYLPDVHRNLRPDVHGGDR